LYQFVGVFGAGTLVDFIEGELFETHINPWINSLVTRYIPWEILRSLLAEEYGIFTLGVRYAIAIILPIVGTFFLTFSLIEDSGYLPRIALLVDRLFKRIGLNGRAVIPMTLGFGCDTMATLVTRTLETTRERVIATLLLALAIPCSAQLGIVLALLAGNVRALLVWACFVGGVFLLIGFLTARLLPGESPSFYLELPPLRWPKPSNVLLKTYARIQWYFLEVLPLFILASVLIWLGKLSGAFDLGISLLKPLVRGIGLPEDAAVAFLFGFFRRDYGAAGLYDLQQSGALSGNQLVVAAATLTLFVPCIAQFSIMWKERGPKTTLAIVSFIFPFAFAMGYLLHLGLTLLGIQL
ncbi:MAG: ferrous iron transporter B, partial [Nitrospinota bacterium]